MKDIRGNEITHEMMVDLAKSLGVTMDCIEDWIEDGFIRHIPGPVLCDSHDELDRQVKV